jgi:hypothetical protein
MSVGTGIDWNYNGSFLHPKYKCILQGLREISDLVAKVPQLPADEYHKARKHKTIGSESNVFVNKREHSTKSAWEYMRTTYRVC